jgi:preprotein translocase subunit YajC
MLIRPQQKRMRQQMELMNNLRVGDDVMTSAGIYGTISEIEEDTVLLEVAEDVLIRVAKNAIVRNFTQHEEGEREEPEEQDAEVEKEEEEEKE